MRCAACGEAVAGDPERCPHCGAVLEVAAVPLPPAPRTTGWLRRLEPLLQGHWGLHHSARTVVIAVCLVGLPFSAFLHYLFITEAPAWYPMAVLAWVGVTYLVFVDAEEHGGVGVLWAAVVFALGLPGLIVYLAFRHTWVAP